MAYSFNIEDKPALRAKLLSGPFEDLNPERVDFIIEHSEKAVDAAFQAFNGYVDSLTVDKPDVRRNVGVAGLALLEGEACRLSNAIVRDTLVKLVRDKLFGKGNDNGSSATR